MSHESIYKGMSIDDLEEISSRFLIDSWSYSKLTTFARNEKAFEMSYIYNIKAKSSATTIAGNAYHAAMEHFFNALKLGLERDIVELEAVAFSYIEDVAANDWKLQKTTPTIEEAKKKAYTVTSALLKNFFKEASVFLDEIQEVLGVEISGSEFITVNGVDIPLPCNYRIDVLVLTKDGKRVIMDHKSKTIFTPEEELALAIGVQAITYVKCSESSDGEPINEVWFIENKSTQNKDKSAAQINVFKVSLTEDTRRLYEALLYEPLRRLIQATSDPDYVYLINFSDNFIDLAEMCDFWARTMISEVDDFDIPEAKRELVEKRIKKVRDASIASISPKVIREFRSNAASFIQYDLSNKNMTPEEKIEHVLRTFGIVVKVAHCFSGYSSNTFLIEPSAGVKITSIQTHKLDIANALDVSNARIGKDLIVYEGKSYLSVECSKKRDKVLNFDPTAVVDYKLPIGKDNFDRTIVWDLDNHSTPHVLVCGATGSGKSVMLRSTIEAAKVAGVEEIFILDPKFEFRRFYKGDSSVVVVSDIEKIEDLMERLVEEMNVRVEDGIQRKTLIIFDEFADAYANSRKGAELDIKEMVQVGTYAPKKGVFGFLEAPEAKMALKTIGTRKSLEENLRLLLQKGRDPGFRIVAATQRASVKVINGDSKVNFPVQICFRVPKETDSRVVIDEPGAESLAGMGDGLMKSPEYPDTVRFQAYYIP